LGQCHQSRSDSDASKESHCPSPNNDKRVENLLQQAICCLTSSATPVIKGQIEVKEAKLGGQNAAETKPKLFFKDGFNSYLT
jgi:hypothetical protein